MNHSKLDTKCVDTYLMQNDICTIGKCMRSLKIDKLMRAKPKLHNNVCCELNYFRFW